MEWCFELPNGAVTIRQEGRCAVCRAIYRTDEPSLFKAWLIGKRGRILLGTLIPEGGALRLHRSIEISQLERQGAWPPTGAEILAAYSLTTRHPPKGWCLQNEPWKMSELGEFRSSVQNFPWCFLRKNAKGIQIAIPWELGKTFPLSQLFCLASIKQFDGDLYLTFCFSAQGKPELPFEE